MQNNDTNNDAAIRRLFTGLPHAGAGSQSSFAESLSRRLDAIDAVRKAERSKLHAMRVALCAACLAGFAAGVACSLLMPALIHAVKAAVNAVGAWMPSMQLSDPAAVMVTWILAGTMSLGIAAETFGITRALAANKADNGQ